MSWKWTGRPEMDGLESNMTVQFNPIPSTLDATKLDFRSGHWISDRFEDFGRKPFFVQSHVHHESINIRLKVVSSSNLINWSIRSGRKNSIFDLTIFREVHYIYAITGFHEIGFAVKKIAGIMNLDLYGFCTF